MKQIVFDYPRLKAAIVLLLDGKYGESRTAKVRDAIKSQSSRKFRAPIEPLNELMAVARQSALTALDILDMADRSRKSLETEKEASLSENEKRRRALLVENTRKYRTRCKQALMTEEVRRGRKMTADEAKEFLTERKELWNRKCELFVEAHPELKRYEALAQFSEQLNKEVEARWIAAKDAGAVKARETPSKGRLNALKRKFN